MKSFSHDGGDEELSTLGFWNVNMTKSLRELRFCLSFPFSQDTEAETWLLLIFGPNTYHIDELNESQSEGNFYLLRHVLHRSDEFIVASKEVTHQPLLFLWAQTCKKSSTVFLF